MSQLSRSRMESLVETEVEGGEGRGTECKCQALMEFGPEDMSVSLSSFQRGMNRLPEDVSLISEGIMNRLQCKDGPLISGMFLGDSSTGPHQLPSPPLSSPSSRQD